MADHREGCSGQRELQVQRHKTAKEEGLCKEARKVNEAGALRSHEG